MPANILSFMRKKQGSLEIFIKEDLIIYLVNIIVYLI